MNALVFRTCVTQDHRLQLPEELPTGCAIEVTVRPIIQEDVVDNYQPRTELGRRLLELRRAYVQSGGKLASREELEEEMRDV